jgi:hypothetical protein
VAVRLAVLLGVALALLAGEARAAGPAVLKGRVDGLPAGRGELRAIDLERGTATATAAVSGKRRYRLKAAGGRYGIVASSVRVPRMAERAVAALRLKAGRTREQTLFWKRPRHRRARAAQFPPGFGDVDVPYPAIAVNRFTGSGGGPAWTGAHNGIHAMFITDLTQGLGASVPGCGRAAVVVERERLQDILDEIERGKDPRFDPKTVPKPGHLIRDNASVDGTLDVAGGQLTITVTYTERGTGYTFTVSRTGAEADLFAVQQQVGAELVRQICHPPAPPDEPTGCRARQVCQGPPVAYAGTFSGSFVNPSADTTITWTNGTLRLANRQDQPSPSGASYTYSVVSGAADVTVSVPATPTSCALDGTEQVQMLDSNFGPAPSLQVMPGAGPPYRLSVVFPSQAAVTVTRSQCPNPVSNGSTFDYTIYGTRAVMPAATQTASGGKLEGTASESGPGQPSYTYAWSFSPVP